RRRFRETYFMEFQRELAQIQSQKELEFVLDDESDSSGEDDERRGSTIAPIRRQSSLHFDSLDVPIQTLPTTKEEKKLKKKDLLRSKKESKVKEKKKKKEKEKTGQKEVASRISERKLDPKRRSFTEVILSEHKTR